MYDSERPLVFVGIARGALRAVESIGSSVVLVVPHGRAVPEHDAIESVCRVELHGSFDAIEASLRAQLGGRRPSAVVALAERTVLVSAKLRAALDAPGNSEATALACADKVVMKRTMDAAGIPVAPWREIEPGTSAIGLVEALGLPLVIKPRRDSGGRGQQRLTDLGSVERALARFEWESEPPGYGWLAEGWIEGVEMSVEALVENGRPIFLNPTEYFVPRHANILPAVVEADLLVEIRAFVERAVEALGVERGVTHLELFRTRDGLVFGELASRPPGGRLMTLIERAWGFDPWESLLRLEQGEPVSVPAAAHQVAGVWILHPEPGKLVSVRGLEAARAVPLVRRIALKVRAGDLIPERLGSGQDVAAIYAEGPTRDAVATALTRANNAIEFDVA